MACKAFHLSIRETVRLPEEPNAEPGIFQSRYRLFSTNDRKPGNQFNKAERAAREWSKQSRVGYQSNLSTKGQGKSRGLNKGCLLQL